MPVPCSADNREGPFRPLPLFVGLLLFHSSHPLAHRFLACNVDGVGLVHHAVDDGVGNGPVAQVRVPCRRRELRAQDERSDPVPRLDYLHNLPGLIWLDLLQQPIVDDQQIALDVLPALLEPFLVFEDGELVQQLRQPGVAHGVERVAGSHSKGVGYPGLAGSARPCDDDVAPARDPRAVGQLDHLGAVEFSVVIVADIGDIRILLGKARLPQVPKALVGPARVPFGVDDHGEALVEAQS